MDAPGPARFATLANLVTASRVVCIPLLVAAIVNGAALAAAGIFAFAVATDLVDGRLARNRGEASSLGGLFDHATDALLCSLGLGALAWIGELPAPLPFLVAAAFLQYVADSRSLQGEPLRASFLGRWNGICYFVLLGVPIVRDALGLAWPTRGVVLVLGWTLVVSTLLSMADRLFALVMRSSRRSPLSGHSPRRARDSHAEGTRSRSPH